MASIVLSFVGNQDPYSDNTEKEGSIVTLIRHLQTENQVIRKIILLNTIETKERAEITKDWLQDELKIPREIIELIGVDEKLSADPINLLLASQAARHAIDLAFKEYKNGDVLEFNASSGTPVMKSAWSILQAAGYAPHSRVWQIRNPLKSQQGQKQVFLSNVNVLKDEFDVNLLKKQINNHNYAGALTSLETSNISSPLIKGLIAYGYYRLGFNFDKAFAEIQEFKDELPESLWTEISQLRSRKSEMLLKEAYYKASIQLKNQQYSDFLILLSTFQENLLRYLTKKILLPKNYWDKSWNEVNEKIQTEIKKHEGGELLNYLENYRLPNDKKLRLTGNLNRISLQAILSYFSEYRDLLPLIEKNDRYCQQRNDVVHDLQGVSEIKNAEAIIANMQEILRAITNFSKTNPFDLINTEIIQQLDNYMRGNY